MSSGVAVTVAVDRAELSNVIGQIRALAAAEPTISPRSASQLRRALVSGRLAVARADGTVVGWFLAESCGSGVPELGFLFVAPEYRDGELFRRMLNLLLLNSPRAVAVTFRPDFALWLRRSFGFRESTLAEVSRATRGTFLLRRLTPPRLLAVAQHTATAKPVYLIYHRHRSDRGIPL
jgi:hypothetical protein